MVARQPTVGFAPGLARLLVGALSTAALIL
jgi:hypothetical protein